VAARRAETPKQSISKTSALPVRADPTRAAVAHRY
jgi:hypothetical protein